MKKINKSKGLTETKSAPSLIRGPALVFDRIASLIEQARRELLRLLIRKW